MINYSVLRDSGYHRLTTVHLKKVCMCVCVCVYIHVVARTNSCKNVVLRGCGMLRGSVFFFLATRSAQMNVEVASNVGPKY